MTYGPDRTEPSEDDELSQLRRVESMSLLAASAVHDLSNLLTPILCLSSMLSRELAAGSRTAAMAAEIESAAARASSLVRDVLTFARGGSRSLQPVNANTVVAAMRPLLERVLGDTIELVLVLDEALGPSLLDRSRLEHALLNLTANARSAMPAGGRLTIRTANVGSDRVALTVSDDGMGMSEQVRQSAFERFFTTRDALSGTGLGLASVRRFALESGGSVRLDSELGKGTTVTLDLPRMKPQAESSAGAASSAPKSGNEPVLVVDASEEIQRTVRLVLEGQGYAVIEASSVEAALRHLQHGPKAPAVVLLDATLAQRQPAFLEKLRRYAAGSRILLMTADQDLRDASAMAGTTALSKAFTADDLARAVREALDRSA